MGEFLKALPSVNILNVPEQYLLYCFLYGCSCETLYNSEHIDVPVVEVVRSPVTPDTLQSEASLWSFTPLSTRSVSTSIHPRNDTIPSRPKSAEPSSMSRLFRSNQQMGLPVSQSIDAYSQNSVDDFSSINDDKDDFSPIDYDERRQTAVHTANVRTLSDSPLLRHQDFTEDEFFPVEYSERRQTNVHTASLKNIESPQVAKKKVDSNLPPSIYNFVDFENVEITHQGRETDGDSSSRPRLQTEVHSARIAKQEVKKQKKRDSKKSKSRKGSKKSDKQSPEEKENYRTPSIKRRSDNQRDDDDDDENLSKY